VIAAYTLEEIARILAKIEEIARIFRPTYRKMYYEVSPKGSERGSYKVTIENQASSVNLRKLFVYKGKSKTLFIEPVNQSTSLLCALYNRKKLLAC
jgi:hypothetical protein